jgi:two-component system response regulator RegX3
MRVTVVSALGNAGGAAELSDLGCAVREALAVTPPEEIVAGADLVLVEAGDDGDLGGFVVRRVRAVSPRIPLILAVATSQLMRIDPAWGHDDFVLQPYVPQELYARVRAAEWRASEFTQPERIKIGPLVIDLDAHETLLGGTRVPLANREFELLVFLARGRGRVQRREQILARVWGQRQAGASRSLDVHVRKLRSKLAGAVAIETVRGVGYKLNAP